jgi:hypothetical protein
MSTRHDLEEKIAKAHDALDTADAGLTKANVAVEKAIYDLKQAYADREDWSKEHDSY